MNRALIFIPGIKGTKLYDSNSIEGEILWQDVRFNFKDIERLNLTAEYDHSYVDEDFNTLIKPLNIEPLAYREFWNRLEPGYKNRYIFSYDWRISNTINADNLRNFIEYLIKKSKSIGKEITHFDIVTHSMGNLPIRFYIQKYGMEFIHKIIFTAPPFKGAPDAISALVIGQGMFFNKDEMRKLARTLPALFELLPSYPSYAIDSKTGESVDLFEIENWQQNIVHLHADDASVQKHELINKFVENLKNAKQRLAEVDSWMDGLTQSEKDRILVLVKTEIKTLCNIVVEKNPTDSNPINYFNFDESLMSHEGDGVVPNGSSCVYHDELATYCFRNRVLADDFTHAFFLKDNRVQKIINEYLKTNQDATQFNPEDLIGRKVERVKGLKKVVSEESSDLFASINRVWKIT